MKCVISTNVSVGYKNMLHRGTQFKLRYIHAPTDTADEVRDLRKFIGVVAEDARELGYYVSYSPDSDEQTNRRHDRHEGHVPLSPREIALATRLNKAEQMARRWSKLTDACVSSCSRQGFHAPNLRRRRRWRCK